MRIFVLTGAGLSAESGLGTFRNAPDALWRRYKPEDLATPEAFARDPALVHDFYDMRRRVLLGAEPNDAHRALVRLQRGLKARGETLFLCTQNVDDLHERAASAGPVHSMPRGVGLAGRHGNQRRMPRLRQDRMPSPQRGLVR